MSEKVCSGTIYEETESDTQLQKQSFRHQNTNFYLLVSNYYCHILGQSHVQSVHKIV